MPHTIKLDAKVLTDKGKELYDLIQVDIRDHKVQLKKRESIRAIYFGQNDRVPRYPGQTNIQLPVITEKIEGIVPKLSNAFWNADPIVHVQRVVDEFAEEDTETVEKFLNWAIDADIPDFYDTFQMWMRNHLVDGVSTVKPYWNFETRNTVVIEHIKSLWYTGETDLFGQPIPEDRPKLLAEILIELFGNDPKSRGWLDIYDEESNPTVDAAAAEQSIEGISFRVDFVDGRVKYENILVEFHESKYIDEVDVYIYRPIVVSDNPVVEVVEFEDLIIPFRTSSLQTAERITHQYWLTIAQVKSKMQTLEWVISEEDFEKLETHARGGERQEENVENDGMRRQKDRQLGELSHDSAKTEDQAAPYNDSKILVYEVYVREDLNDDGTGEEVIYQIPHYLKKIVQSQYLEEPFPHGRRPFPELHHIRVSDRWYSISLAELLAPINVEVNAIVNMVNENQELINNPFFFYVPSAFSVETEILENIPPGKGIPIGDPNGVVFPKFPQEPLANLSAVDTLLLFADRLTISPQSVGSSQVRNSPRTARGTLALLSEAGIKTDMLITAAQRGGWRELIHQIHALYEAFGPEEKYFKVTGEAKPRKLVKDELRGRFEFKFSGNSVNTNREVERSIAQVRYNTLVANPLYAMDPNALLELTKDFIKHFGEGVNADKITPKMPGQGLQHAPMDQVTENRRMMNGEALDALATDNHTMHLDVLTRFMASKEADQLSPVVVAFLGMHGAQHSRYMQQQAATGGLTPSGGTQGNNVPSGITAGTDMNALEGGVS